MKILPIKQGSQEWLDWRLDLITATDAPIIIGKLPVKWKNKVQLWEEKLKIKNHTKMNDAMKRGIELEPKAREIFCETTGIKMTPRVVESDEYYWMGASLDGLSECSKYVLEIKCPNLDTHLFALQGGVKPYYMSQIQHQLSVTGCEKAYYMTYRPEHKPTYAIIEIWKDQEYIKNLVEKEKEFFEINICQMKKPELWTFKSTK